MKNNEIKCKNKKNTNEQPATSGQKYRVQNIILGLALKLIQIWSEILTTHSLNEEEQMIRGALLERF